MQKPPMATAQRSCSYTPGQHVRAHKPVRLFDCRAWEESDGSDIPCQIGASVLQRPRSLPGNPDRRHAADPSLGVRRLEGREHVMEDRLLHPRGSVEHGTALDERTRRRGVPGEPLHQQLQEVPDRNHEARRHVHRSGPDCRARHRRAKVRGSLRVVRIVPLAAREARGHLLRGRSEDARRLPVPDRRAEFTEDAREGDRREPARHPLSALPGQQGRRDQGRGRAHRHDRQPRLRAARTDRRRPEDLRCRVPGRPGVRNRAPGMGNVSRQSRGRRVPADHLDVHSCGDTG